MVLELIYVITATLLAVYGMQALFLTLIARLDAMPGAAASPPPGDPGTAMRNRAASGLQ